MKYTVVWTRNAEDLLAQVWLNASNRQEVRRATDEIDLLLHDDPELQGESRPNGRRMLLNNPVGVVYQVKPDDRVVEVLYVWRIG